MKKCFKPHQRGGGCCSGPVPLGRLRRVGCFKPHQRGGGCCSATSGFSPTSSVRGVSNPISGEVGAAAWFIKLPDCF